MYVCRCGHIANMILVDSGSHILRIFWISQISKTSITSFVNILFCHASNQLLVTGRWSPNPTVILKYPTHPTSPPFSWHDVVLDDPVEPFHFQNKQY